MQLWLFCALSVRVVYFALLPFERGRADDQLSISKVLQHVIATFIVLVVVITIAVGVAKSVGYPYVSN